MNKGIVMPMLLIALLLLSAGIASAEQPQITPSTTAQPPGITAIGTATTAEPSRTITTDASTTAKVCQLIGEYDRQLDQYTESRTASRFKVYGTDLGASVVYDGKLWFFFGDTWKGVDQNHFTQFPFSPNDAVAFVEPERSAEPEPSVAPEYKPMSSLKVASGIDRCLKLEFVAGRDGTFLPITISGGDVKEDAFSVPTGAFEADAGRGEKEMYLFYKTDATINNFPVTFGSTVQNRTAMMRSVLAKRTLLSSFEYLYDFSIYPGDSAVYPDTKPAFITNSPVVVDSSEVPGLPVKGKGVLIFGSGLFRLSNVYLAFISLSDLEKRETPPAMSIFEKARTVLSESRYHPLHVYYYAGKDLGGAPIWRDDWGKHNVNAQPIVDMGDQPDVGDISVALDRETGFWYMTYYSSRPPGEKAIHFRYAPMAEPWNFSSQAQELIVPSLEPPVGFGQFMHVANSDDGLSDPGREDENSAGYGPYLIPSRFRTLSVKDGQIKREISFVYSTWNPYTVELMKSVITISGGARSTAPKAVVTPAWQGSTLFK